MAGARPRSVRLHRILGLINTGFCLDVRDGVFANGRSVQIWECDEFSTKNQNQLFKFQW